VNLYWVQHPEADYGEYVFAETPGKAKSLARRDILDDDYTELRARIVKKDVGGEPQACDDDCDRLKALGVRYMTEEEMSEGECY
jgi:hypothetical protein